MGVLRVIVGIFASLVAVFAGGCSLIIFGMGIVDWFSGYQYAFINFDAMLIIGVLPAVIGGLVARACFRKRPKTGEGDNN